MKMMKKSLMAICAISTISAFSMSAMAAPVENNNPLESLFKQNFEKVYNVPNIPSIEEILKDCINSGRPLPPPSDCLKPEFPKPEQPKPEQPKPEPPKPEQPKPEQPKPEPPKPEPPKPEPPKPEQPKPEPPKPEQPKPEPPKPEPPKPEQPKPEPPGAGSEAAFEAEVVRLVNNARREAGLSELKTTAGVTSAARVRASEQAVSFSHTRPNGSSFSSALTEAGVKYRSSGENIAYGQSTPSAVFNAWMNSEGHRRNIMNPSFDTIGVGCYKKGGTLYWTQLFVS